MPSHNNQQLRLAQDVTRSEPVPGLSLYTYRMGADIATISGSVYGGEDVCPAQAPLASAILTALLEEGTKEHSKQWIHQRLESLGATVSFSSEGRRIVFDAQCRARDVGEVLALLFEQLMVPSLKQSSLATVQRRLIAQCQQANDSTTQRAKSLFVQQLYTRTHPNYELTPAQAIKQIRATTISTVRQFHRTHVGLGDALCSVVGDMDHEDVAAAIETAADRWKRSPDADSNNLSGSARRPRAHEEVITMRDKTSTDVFMGAYHGLRHADDDFYPLLIGLQILGGKGFDARLMQEVRERRGLTYGAFAALRGTKHGYDGYWYAWSTFAPELLHDGLAVMRDEIQRLVRDGVSQQEVSDKITSMTGQYTVGLANTSGIAYTLRTNAEEGYAIDEIDRFPSRLAAVTAEQVNAALQRHIDPDMLITVVSGAVNDYKQPLHCNE